MLSELRLGLTVRGKHPLFAGESVFWGQHRFCQSWSYKYRFPNRGALDEAAAVIEKTGRTTLLLDGIWGNHLRMRKLRKVLRDSVGPTQIWIYDNTGRTPLRKLGEELAIAIRNQQQQINLVGYSMGGLVIRAALTDHPDIDVARIVTLNTPHQGSLAAGFLPLAACRDMRPGSDFLAETNAAPWRWPTLAVWCPGDLMVVPGWNAKWEKADREVASFTPAHIWPVYGREIHQTVANFLNEEPQEPQPASA